MSTFWSGLHVGTLLEREDGFTIILLDDMNGEWAHWQPAKKDGRPDMRYGRSSGSLLIDVWALIDCP